LKYFLDKEYRGDRRIIIEAILTAKTPLIEIKIPNNRKMIKIDLLVNNVLGIINSKFLKVYSSIPWIRNLGLLVKIWAKNVTLIGKSNLSSYAIILMLIHFLIKHKYIKAILDNRIKDNQRPHF
jgi:DNA polymerase sigma